MQRKSGQAAAGAADGGGLQPGVPSYLDDIYQPTAFGSFMTSALPADAKPPPLDLDRATMRQIVRTGAQ